ncbi:Fic family protein [Sphingobacterium alkalisoli]|uniref:Fic family protein n=1 Tax=Sphingobacterium alkalisoli TaxID=1874115 RepID=UPI0035712DFF
MHHLNCLNICVKANWIKMTKPHKPNSRAQMYQITLEGKKYYSSANSKLATIVIHRAV